MLDTKVMLRLKHNAIPTVYNMKCDDRFLLPFESRCERQARKRIELCFKFTNIQYTNKKKYKNDKLNVLEKQNEHSFDLSYISSDSIQEFENNGNNKDVQCDLGNECINQCLSNTNYALLFELCEKNSEEECDKDGISKYVEDNDAMSKPNIENNSCFIVFWEDILCLFKYCQECSTKNVSIKHYVQGLLLYITTAFVKRVILFYDFLKRTKNAQKRIL